MKYRIKQKGNKFYIQEKKLLFWNYVIDSKTRSWTHSSWDDLFLSKGLFVPSYSDSQMFITGLTLNFSAYYSTSLEEAREYLIDYKRRLQNLYYRKHRIIETQDGYFIDISSNIYYRRYEGYIYFLYSKDYEELKQLIDKFEEYRKTSKIRRTYEE